jgi:hypothetical protein
MSYLDSTRRASWVAYHDEKIEQMWTVAAHITSPVCRRTYRCRHFLRVHGCPHQGKATRRGADDIVEEPWRLRRLNRVPRYPLHGLQASPVVEACGGGCHLPGWWHAKINIETRICTWK